MLQVSAHSPGDGDLVLVLSVGGVGIFLLVTILLCVGVRMVNKNTWHEDMEGILDAEENYINDHFEIIENKKAIFTIETNNSVSSTADDDEMKSEDSKIMETKVWRFVDAVKLFRFYHCVEK